jgi:hypothetical protein
MEGSRNPFTALKLGPQRGTITINQNNLCFRACRSNTNGIRQAISNRAKFADGQKHI